MSLTIPTPTISQNGTTLDKFSAVMPVNVACGPVTFPDGSELALHTADPNLSGLRLRRRLADNSLEIWDDEAKNWQPDGSEPALLPIFFKDDLWQSLVVDTEGHIFGTDPTTGRPEYFIECVFAGTDSQGAQHTDSSPASLPFQAFKTEDQDRAGMTIDPEPSEADEVRLFLKDNSLVERASIAIRNVSGNFQIELAARDTRLTWTEDGEAILTASNGRQVKLSVTSAGNLVLEPDVANPATLTVQRNGGISIVTGGTSPANVTLQSDGDIIIDPAAGRTATIQGNLNVNGVLRVNGIQMNVP